MNAPLAECALDNVRTKTVALIQSRFDKHIKYSLDHDENNINNWIECPHCRQKKHPDAVKRHQESCKTGIRASSDKANFKIRVKQM